MKKMAIASLIIYYSTYSFAYSQDNNLLDKLNSVSLIMEGYIKRLSALEDRLKSIESTKFTGNSSQHVEYGTSACNIPANTNLGTSAIYFGDCIISFKTKFRETPIFLPSLKHVDIRMYPPYPAVPNLFFGVHVESINSSGAVVRPQIAYGGVNSMTFYWIAIGDVSTK